MVENGASLTLFHPIERLTKSPNFIAVLGPVTGALRVDGALVVCLRLFREDGELR